MEMSEENSTVLVDADIAEVPEDTCQVFVYNRTLVDRLKGELTGVAEVAALFRALADEGRCTMLMALGKSSELCVCDLSEITGLAMPTVSHHLRKLREQDLVRTRREGKLVFYRLVDEDTRLLLRVAATRGLVPAGYNIPSEGAARRTQE